MVQIPAQVLHDNISPQHWVKCNPILKNSFYVPLSPDLSILMLSAPLLTDSTVKACLFSRDEESWTEVNSNAALNERFSTFLTLCTTAFKRPAIKDSYSLKQLILIYS